MKRYSVVVEDSAQEDIKASYDWGCRVWGKRQANKWVRELRTAIVKQLARFPFSGLLAPENGEFDHEIRQLVVGRYRMLYTVQGKSVHVLHVRGAYIADPDESKIG